MATVDTQFPTTAGTASHENQNGQTNRGRGNGRRPHRGRGGGHRPNRNNNPNGTGEATNGSSQADGTPLPHNAENRGKPRRTRPPRNKRDPQAQQTDLPNGGQSSQQPNALLNPATPNFSPSTNNTAPTATDSPARQEGRNDGARGGRGGRGGPRGRGGRGRGGANLGPRPAHNGRQNGTGHLLPQPGTDNATARTTGPHRRFGGELTTETQGEKFDEDDTSDLPEEKPVIVKAAATQNKRQKAPKEAKTYKEAEDLMGRIHQELSSGNYECMICFGGVTRRSKIWDCKVCYAVFHMSCIQKWAAQGVSAPSREEGADEPAKMWRCPGCQNKLADVPKTYQCWCGKSQAPEAVKYLPPHSCGGTCGKKRPSPASCPHPCDLQCHAGPCPPCTTMGPVQSCFCGKESAQRRCSETAYEDNGWTCGQVCNNMMPCGIHKCKKTCHTGPCGACPETEVVKCYCGKASKVVKCSEKSHPQKSIEIKDGELVDWEGFYQCELDCEK